MSDNDNEPAPPRPVRLVPLIGEINVDTGVFTKYDVVELLRWTPPATAARPRLQVVEDGQSEP